MRCAQYPASEGHAIQFRLVSFDLAVRREALAYGIELRELPKVLAIVSERQSKRLARCNARLRVLSTPSY